MLVDLREGMPAFAANDLDYAFAMMRRDGIPPNIREGMNHFTAAESVSLFLAARITKDLLALAERGRHDGIPPVAPILPPMQTLSVSSSESSDSSAKVTPQQKGGAHDPGPQGSLNTKPGSKSGAKSSKPGLKSGAESSKSSPNQGNQDNQGSGGGGQGQSSQGQGQGKKPPLQGIQFKLDWTTVAASSLVSFLLYRLARPGENSKEITWQEFRTRFIDKGLVEKVVVLNERLARVYLNRELVAQLYPDSPGAQPNFYYYFTIGSIDAFERRLDEAQAELQIGSADRIPVAYASEISWLTTVLSFGPTLLLIGSVFLLSRRAASGGQSGIFGMGRSRAKRFNHETDVKVKFADVAGMDEAKAEIMEFVSFLKEPGVYQKLGAKIPRGAILSGPPGTGKTLLAKATAGESAVPFFSVSGSEFVEMFVGVGASRVRDLFANARKNTPCIIFIDEIDAIGKSRTSQKYGGGERRARSYPEPDPDRDGRLQHVRAGGRARGHEPDRRAGQGAAAAGAF